MSRIAPRIAPPADFYRAESYCNSSEESVGYLMKRIMLSIIVEGMILCSFGCAFGVVVGFVAALLFAVIPVIGTYISFIPTVGLTTPILLMAFVLCLIGSLYPAWRAVRTTPAAALQRV